MAEPVSVDEVLARARALVAAHGAGDAAFDADGTLWRGDVGEACFARAAAAGLVSPDVVRGPLAAWARAYDLTLDENPARACATIADALDDGTLVARGAARGQPREDTLADVYAMQAWCYAGHTEDALRAFGRAVFDDEIRAGVFAHTRALFDGLRAHDVTPVIVSASPAFFVEAAVEALGLGPVPVIAMTAALDDGVVVAAPGRVVYQAGKVRFLDEVRGARPHLAFGDTVAGGDLQLLQHARVNVAVAPRGVHREAARARPDLLLLDVEPA